MNEQNLSDVMHGFMDAERRAAEVAAPDTTAETHALARRIGRRRAVRGAGIGIASVLVLGAVAVGVNALERAEPPLPAKPSPSPSVTVTPTPEPSTPAPTSTPQAPEVPPTAYLTDAVPMPAGTFARTNETWRLLEFGDSTDAGVVAPTTLYLVGPDATVYTVPAPFTLQGWTLLDWRPGTGEVLLADDSATNRGTLLVDLADGSEREIDFRSSAWNPAQFVPDRSGDVLRLAASDGLRTIERVDADAQVTARTPGFSLADLPIIWSTSPEGTSLVVNDARGPALYSVDSLDPMAMDSPYPDRPDACRTWSWTSDTELLLQCSENGASTFDQWVMASEFWLVPTDGGSPTQVLGMPDATRVGGAWRVDGRMVVSMAGVTESEATWWEWTGQALTPLGSNEWPLVDVLGVQGGEIVFTESSYSREATDPYQNVVTLDPFTGDRHVLIATPPATLGTFVTRPVGQVEAWSHPPGD